MAPFFQDQNNLFGTSWVPRSAKETSLRGGMQHPSQQALFVCFCLHCLTTDMPLGSFAQSVLKGLRNEKGLFLGMLGIATTDFLGQESDLLTIRAAPAKHPITTACHSMQWPFGHSFEGGAKPL